MNKHDDTPTRYEYLLCLRSQGGKMTAAALAETMNVIVPTVWAVYGHLQNEGLFDRFKSGKGPYIIRVTDAGYAWKEPIKASEPDNRPKHSCGCPVVASTPTFCLEHRRQRNRERYEQEGTRYYTATLSQVLER